MQPLFFSLVAVSLCAAAADAQQMVQYPESLDPALNRSAPAPVAQPLGARTTAECDDFNRATLGPNWISAGGSPMLVNDGFTGIGNSMAQHAHADLPYDTAVIEFDLPDSPSALTYGAAVHGLGGGDNLFTKVQSNAGGGFYDFMGFYHALGAGGFNGYGGFFALTTPIVGGHVTVYVDPMSNGDTMVIDIDENRDGVVDYTYTSSGIVAAFATVGLGTKVGVGAFGNGSFVSCDDWELNDGCGPQGPGLVQVGTCGNPGSGLQGNGFTPFSPVGLAFSPNPGNLMLPAGPCGLVQTELGGPVFIVAVLAADGNGDWVFPPGLTGIPGQACGGYMQALDLNLGSCALSNSVQLQ